MAPTWALSFLSIFRLSMRAENSWPLLSTVSSLRAAVTAVGCSSCRRRRRALFEYCRFIVCGCRRRHVLPKCYRQLLATVVVVCCRSSISDSCVAAAAVIVFLVCCFMFASEPLFKFMRSSLDFREFFQMSRDLRMVPMMWSVSCILYFCRDSVSNLGFPILLSCLRMVIENAQEQICGHFTSESCRSLQRPV